MAKKDKTPAAAAAPAETEKTKSKSASAIGSRGPRGVPDTAAITRLVDANPKKPSSKCWHRFELYKTGMTVGNYLDAGGFTPDLVYDTKHGFIKIEGYDPALVVKKERPLKAEKPAKAKKASATESPEQAAADAEANEEQMA
jgi:hypothetical protein